MGGWMVAGIAFGAAMTALCIGAVVGAYFTYRHMLHQVAVARSQADQERQRADNAVDSLARQIRGEPISLAAREVDARTFEETLRAREDLQEMFQDETEVQELDVPSEQ